MTIRAFIIGLVGAICIATLGYVNDQILQFGSIVFGGQLPLVVIGLLVVAQTVVNPLLGLRKGWGLKSSELAVIVMLLLVSCSIPSRGLLEHITPALGLPAWYNNDVSKGWKRNNTLSHVPPAMLPAGGRYDPAASDGLVSGLGDEGRPIGLDEVPWDKWATPLAVWLPIFALVTVAMLCAALMVYRQWAVNERLRFPIAEFASALMERPEGSRVAPIFRDRLFWLAALIIFAIHLNNGLNPWTNGDWINIPMNFSFGAILQKFPSIADAPWGYKLLNMRIYPVVIGFSFFLASEVSLSLGLTQLVFIPMAAALIYHGVDMKTDYVAGGAGGWLRFGSYAAMGVILLYTGRRHYWDALRAALTFRKSADLDRATIWACRVLILSLAALSAIATALGLAWPLAILFFLLMLLSFVVMTRINVETGLFFIHHRWQPLGVMLGLLGGYAMGPEAMVIVGLLGTLLCLDISQALMCYFTNSLRICDKFDIRPSRAVWPAGATWFLAAAAGLIVAFWASYNYGIGTRRNYNWDFQRVPTMALGTANREINQLRLSGELEQSISLANLERLTAMRPDGRFLAWAGAGAALVLVVGGLRLRLSWWPLHPVMFLVWDTFPMAYFSHSFLIGYIVKSIVTRVGGHGTYQKLKPLMIGLITGDLLGVLLWMIVGLIYYLATGLAPPVYDYLPS